MRIVLALNAGSSTLKFGLFGVHRGECDAMLSGSVETNGAGDGRLVAHAPEGRILACEHVRLPTLPQGAIRTFDLLRRLDAPKPEAIGHRIVHGGPECVRHVRIDDTVLERLRGAADFAPLHVPAALSILDAARHAYPGLPHVACLDTDFHAGMPEAAKRLPLPAALLGAPLHRYGFHGLSCESVVRQLGHALPERLVVAHLGGGSSVTAIRAGRSIDTSMGLTPAGGVIMQTRSGDLDPGVLVHLMRHGALDADQIEEIVERRSGLAGISGLDGDMRHLHRAAATSPSAALAIDMFCLSARKGIAAMAASLSGVELLIFTGGIGENDAAMRDRICDGLGWMGLGSEPASIRVMPSHEEERIAFHTARLTE